MCKGQVFMFPECGGTDEGEECSTGAVTEVQGCSLITQACFCCVTPASLFSQKYIHVSPVSIRASDPALWFGLQ